MKKRFFPDKLFLVASLVCFSSVEKALFAANDFYATQATEPGTESSSSCTTCNSSTNTCCTFVDALNAVQSVSGASSTITITVPTITYTGAPYINNLKAYDCTIGSSVSNGSVVNFQEFESGGFSFNPTYEGSSVRGYYILNNVVFQNGIINNAGGSITIDRTSTVGGATFSGNTWYAQGWDGQQPSYTFANVGPYSQPFSGSIRFNLNGNSTSEPPTEISIINQYTGTVTISSAITGSSQSAYVLNASSTGGGTLLLSGAITTVAVVNITEGAVTLSGANNITTTNILSGSTFSLNAANSLSSGNVVNLNSNSGSGATLALNVGSSSTFNFSTLNLVAGSNTINVPSSASTIGAKIEGVGSMVKTGAGTFVLSNTANSYSGGTTLSAGTLSITTNSGTPLGSGHLTFDAAATLAAGATTTSLSSAINVGSVVPHINVTSGQTFTLSGQITGTGGFAVGQSLSTGTGGTLVLTNASNSYGNTAIYNGIVRISAPGQLGPSSASVISYGVNHTASFLLATSSLTLANPVVLDGELTFLANDGVVFTVSSLVSGGSALIFGDSVSYSGGVGSFSLTNTGNTYSYNTYLWDGTVIVSTNSGTPYGHGSFLFESGYGSVQTLQSGATTCSLVNNITMSSSAATIDVLVGQTLTLSGLITGTSGFSVGKGLSTGSSGTNAGFLKLTNASNSYGNTTIYNGVVEVSAAGQLGPSSASIISQGGNQYAASILASSSFTLANPVVANGDMTFLANTGITLTVSGLISGGGSVSLGNSDIYSGGIGSFSFTNTANTYTGTTYLTDGTAIVSTNSGTPYGKGTLYFESGQGTVQTLQSGATTCSLPNNISLFSTVGTIDVQAGQTLTLSGVISGSEGFILQGGGTLALSNTASSYTGPTGVEDGTLNVVAPATTTLTTIRPLGTSAVTLSSGTTFLVSNASASSSSQANVALANSFSDTGSGSTSMNVYGCTPSTTCSGVNQVTLTGALTFGGTLNINNPGSTYGGYLSLTGASNSIEDLSINGGRLYLFQSASLMNSTSTAASLTIDGGALFFSNNFTSSSPLTSNITIHLDTSGANTINDSGFNVQIDSLVTGSGRYYKDGTGVQTLTDTNTYTGGTTVAAGTLSIDSIAEINSGAAGITLDGGTLFVNSNAGGTVTISSSTTLAVTGSAGGLAAYEAKSLSVESPISGSGVLQIGSSQMASATGNVILAASGNTFTGSIILGALSSGGATSYPAMLSMDTASRMGTPTSLTVQAGSTFVATASFSTGSLPIQLDTGSGTFSVGSGLTLTIPGIISTSASSVTPLTIAGGGTAVLGGANTFNGDLNILASSTVQVGSTSNLGANTSGLYVGLNNSTLHITGNINSLRGVNLNTAGTINVDASVQALFEGGLVVTSGATLTKSGTGLFSILPSTSAAIPSLVVSGGTFVGNSLNLANSTIDVASSGLVSFFQTSSGAFTGTISGAGYVDIGGPGSLTFESNTNTYTGGTIVRGTLIISQDVISASQGVLGASTAVLIGNGGTIRTTDSFSTSRTIALVGGVDTTFSPDTKTVLELTGAIGGTGGLIKAGSGVLVLAGDSTYTGKTYVNSGALIVTGDIVASGDPIVAVGALLSGTGSVGTTDVYGTVKGGNPLGTLTITGDLILEEDSNFATVLVSETVSLVDVSGAVTISPNANYLIAAFPGTFDFAPQVVLSGGSITGTFASVHGLEAFFATGDLTYTSTEVLLSLQSRSVVELATGQNAINLANSLDDAISFNRTQVTYTVEPEGLVASPTPELADVLTSLIPFTTTDEMTYALNQIHPAQLKGMAISQESNAVQVRQALSVRLQNELDAVNCLAIGTDTCPKNKKNTTVWISGIGEFLKQNNERNGWGPLTGYHINTGGFVAGIDRKFCEYLYVGMMGGYTHSHLHWNSGKGQGNISSGYTGIYLSALGKYFYGNASVTGSWSGYSAHRNIRYSGVDLVAKNDHGGRQILSHLDTGFNFDVSGITIRPFDSFDYISQVEYGYTEKGAGQWNLASQKSNPILMRNELGLVVSTCYCTSNIKWTLSPKLSWVREIRIKGADSKVDFAQGSSSFVIEGYFPDRSLLAPGLTVTGLMFDDTLAFDLYYSGEFGSGYGVSNYGGQARYSF